MEILTIFGGVTALAAIVNGVVGVWLAVRKLDAKRASVVSDKTSSVHVRT